MLRSAGARLLRLRKHQCLSTELQAGGACLASLSSLAPSPSSSSGDTFRAADLEVQHTQHPQPKLPLEELSFGAVFTDHMLLIEQADSTGWGRPRIQPFAPLQLHPATQVLHYGNCCFEGMKAYAGVDGRGRLFRPDMNMARFQRSLARLMLADFDTKELLECLKALLRVDRPWLPDKQGYSMYLRPFAFASDATLGVHRSHRTTLSVVMCPVGPYFKTGAKAVDLFLDTTNVRAWPGGAGAFKIGGNYAPTVLPQVQAAQHGCAQVVYALPQGPDPDSALISECGSMNLFFLIEPRAAAGAGGRAAGRKLELVTPPLDGTILPGVTRDSIIKLASSWTDLTVSERALTVGELGQAYAEGRLKEAFGAGTACVVQPIGGFVRGSDDARMTLQFDPSNTSSLVARLTKALSDIQYGRTPHEWSVPFE